MRKVSKTGMAKFFKEFHALMAKYGAIEMNTTDQYDTPVCTDKVDEALYSPTGNLVYKDPKAGQWVLETVYGLLWLRPDVEEGDSVYTVFGRFDHEKKPFSNYFGGRTGKFNFHYSDLNSMLENLGHDLKLLFPRDRKVITSYDDLMENDTYDARSIIMVIDGKFFKNSRVCIDSAERWDAKTGKMVMVDAVGHIITKRTKFQLIIDGNVTIPK